MRLDAILASNSFPDCCPSWMSDLRYRSPAERLRHRQDQESTFPTLQSSRAEPVRPEVRNPADFGEVVTQVWKSTRRCQLQTRQSTPRLTSRVSRQPAERPALRTAYDLRFLTRHSLSTKPNSPHSCSGHHPIPKPSRNARLSHASSSVRSRASLDLEPKIPHESVFNFRTMPATAISLSVRQDAASAQAYEA